ncbi:LysR family transcriptional regulator [Thalassococcus sp. BH17M4-6]|uniref:LysR family transcriptional regulator n=1 Tax=Thalassococcus sp. BH17M4-6 TaxID=3413148 RepID=UPI003BDAAC55
MNNWDDLRFLVAVSKAGTMSGAARSLGTNTATVSRRMERLSESLGTQAFIKTADGWRPSDAVAQLIQLAQTFDGEIQSALNNQTGSPSAEPVKIDIACPPVITAEVLVPGMRRHSDMLDGISLSFSDRVTTGGLGDHDVVIQYGAPETGRVITRRVGDLSFRLFEFTENADTSGNWAGLNEEHDETELIQFGFENYGRPPSMRLNSIMALLHLMKVSRLPGPLPDITATREGGLRPVSPNKRPFVADFWMFYHESRRTDPKVRATADFIMKCFAEVETLADTSLKCG